MSKSKMVQRCEAEVFRRDCYRRTGRGIGFEMYYQRGRCKRSASKEGLCSQHARMNAIFPVQRYR